MLGPTAKLPEPTTLEILRILNFFAINLSPLLFLFFIF